MRPSCFTAPASLAFLLTASAASAAQAAMMPLPVRVYDTAGIPGATLAAALPVASAALAGADIDPVWHRCDGGRTVARCDAPLRPGELVIRVIRTRGPVTPSPSHVLG